VRRVSAADNELGRARELSRSGEPQCALGRLGEELAEAHLGRLGFRTLARNVRTREGEIDLIAFDGRTLVFAEVKTRRAARREDHVRAGDEPLCRLRRSQQLRLRRLAVAWLSDERRSRPTARTIRFDALGVTVDRDGRLLRLEHLEAAW
jgi:putative endonuclease